MSRRPVARPVTLAAAQERRRRRVVVALYLSAKLAAVGALAWIGSGALASEPCAAVRAMPGAVVDRPGFGGDTLAVAPDGIGAYRWCYANEPTSSAARDVIVIDGMEIGVRVDVQGGPAPETITLTPPPGWTVEPAAASVRDGDETEGALFQGMM